MRKPRAHRAASGRCTISSSSTKVALTDAALVGYAKVLDLDTPRFADDLRQHQYAARVREDVAGGYPQRRQRNADVLHQWGAPRRPVRS